MPVTPEISQLADGLRVVTTPIPSSQSVSVNLFVGAGSRGEDERIKGIAHFLEHMMFKGTPKRPTAVEVAEAIEGAGGVLNAYTSKELTCYWNHVPEDRLETGIEVLADMLYNALISPEEIDRERSVVQQEIKRTRDQPGAWAGELLGRAMYGDHPMGWSTAGTEDTVQIIARDDFRDWIATWYGSPNVVVSVAGNTSHDAVVELVGRYFAGGTTVLSSGSRFCQRRRTRAARDRGIAADRAGKRCDRAARARPQGPGPLRSDDLELGPRPRHELTPVQGGARAPGARVFGRIVGEPALGLRGARQCPPASRRRTCARRCA